MFSYFFEFEKKHELPRRAAAPHKRPRLVLPRTDGGQAQLKSDHRVNRHWAKPMPFAPVVQDHGPGETAENRPENRPEKRREKRPEKRPEIEMCENMMCFRTSVQRRPFSRGAQCPTSTRFSLSSSANLRGVTSGGKSTYIWEDPAHY